MKTTVRDLAVALALATGTVALLGSGNAAAKVVLTADEVHAITSVTNSFEGTLDGVMAGEVVRFKIVSPTRFYYEYVNAGENFSFEGELARAGGSINGNPTLNFQQPDQDDVRFEWLDKTRIQFEFWEPGKKAGQVRNNPAMAKAVLTIATDPVVDGEPSVSEERKEARKEAASLLPPGKYNWKPFNTTLTMAADGGFREIGGSWDESGYFIKNGDELCFDIVDGNCYNVSAGENGAYTLTYVAKRMQSTGENSKAGQQTTLTPN